MPGRGTPQRNGSNSRPPVSCRAPQPCASWLLQSRLHAIPVEPTVDLPVNPTPVVLPPTPLALVHRPIAFLLKHMPKQALARGSGTRPRVRISAATSALRTSMQRAAMASEGRARSERRHHNRCRQRVPRVPVLAASLEPNAALWYRGEGETDSVHLKPRPRRGGLSLRRQ
jgi:hypothetical protein